MRDLVRRIVERFPRGPGSAGFSLVETLVAMGIFSILMAGIYGAYINQVRHANREFRTAEADIEALIARNLLVRDIEMAGFGLAEDFGDVEITTNLDQNSGTLLTLSPAQTMAYQATDANPDTLTLLGTSLGMNARQSKHWTYFSPGMTFRTQDDVRERLSSNDRVIVIEPSTKKLLQAGSDKGDWLFHYKGSLAELESLGGVSFSPPVGSLVYGLRDSGAGDEEDTITQPFYAVRYYFGTGTSPASCAPGTNSLLRAESTNALMPKFGNPVFACVRDFQVAFGLDANEDGSIDQWDNGGQIAAGYTPEQLRKRLREVRVYILSHYGGIDTGYTYPTDKIRVGEGLGSTPDIGRDVTLTAAQRNYRWRVTTITATPRNLR